MFAGILTRCAIVGILLVALGVGALQAQAANGTKSVSIAAEDSLELQILAELNKVRAARGLSKLKLAPALSKAADVHSRNMAQRGFFAHESHDGSAFWKRVQRFYKVGSFRSWVVGENLLWSAPTLDAPGAVKLWMESPAHRKNVLDRAWREIGLSAVSVAAAPGVFAGQDVVIVTTDFGVRV